MRTGSSQLGLQSHSSPCNSAPKLLHRKSAVFSTAQFVCKILEFCRTPRADPNSYHDNVHIMLFEAVVLY
jgi:hypothetical protein